MHDELRTQFRQAVSWLCLLCDSPPVMAFSSLLSVSGHFLCLLLIDLVTVSWQVQEDACGELSTARAHQYKNINKLAVLGSRDSGKLQQLSSVHYWKLVKDGKLQGPLGKFASVRLYPCQCYLIWDFFFHRNLAALNLMTPWHFKFSQLSGNGG